MPEVVGKHPEQHWKFSDARSDNFLIIGIAVKIFLRLRMMNRMGARSVAQAALRVTLKIVTLTA